MGSYVTLYGTGAGRVSPPGFSRVNAASASPALEHHLSVTASINGVSATVTLQV